jgi:hypothetical protein
VPQQAPGRRAIRIAPRSSNRSAATPCPIGTRRYVHDASASRGSTGHTRPNPTRRWNTPLGRGSGRRAATRPAGVAAFVSDVTREPCRGSWSVWGSRRTIDTSPLREPPPIGTLGEREGGGPVRRTGVSRLLAWVSWRPHHCATTGYGRGFEAAGRITSYRFGDVQVAKAAAESNGGGSCCPRNTSLSGMHRRSCTQSVLSLGTAVERQRSQARSRTITPTERGDWEPLPAPTVSQSVRAF